MSSSGLDLSYAVGLSVERDVPLGPFTSLKVGGPADYFVRTRSATELSRVLTEAHRRGVPWMLLGGGSNVLIADRGYRGLAIKVEAAPAQRTRAQVLFESSAEVQLRCEAGALSAGVSRWTASLGFRGLEWACGIPGTVGGAAAGNAGAYDGDMNTTVSRLRAWFPDGDRELDVSELGYAYRASRFKRNPEPAAVLSVDLRLTPGSKIEALELIEQTESKRRASQPTERSCGSVFKNPTPLFSGKVIEAAGLKGTSRGGAQISERHGNFFVNRGGATASDVVALMGLARERVLQSQGVTLEVEILLIGDWPEEEVAGL
ncbi:MAG: UDP-N-acetylmuramate dehydrogenase [Chloroflexota bacterium]